MTKAELISHIANQAGTTRAATERVLEALAASAKSDLKYDGEFSLPGIGKLKTSQTPARTGRNPRTGEAVQIAAKTKVKFVTASDLKVAIQ